MASEVKCAACSDSANSKHVIASRFDCRFRLKDVHNVNVATVWTMYKGGGIHSDLTADAAYNACHAISQVMHHVAYDACELLGLAVIEGCSPSFGALLACLVSVIVACSMKM